MMIQLSPTALAEILRLKERSQISHSRLRVKLLSGGCLDFSYSLEFDETIHLEDQTYNCGSIQVVVNADTLSHMGGLVVDYSEDLMGGGFRFHNPHAVQSCGCGNSFSEAC